MKRSSERVRTTHVGSLCRPADVAEALRAREFGEGLDDAEFEKILAPAVADVVRRQTVQWAKLRALSEGARLASERLWS
jgi:5-methyltetrahydropteroyltriglutamate--homocysteine methyltransferase